MIFFIENWYTKSQGLLKKVPILEVNRKVHAVNFIQSRVGKEFLNAVYVTIISTC